ncbi:acetamidase/formamidase family protein [Schlesneria paludicola]|uniref:acetamidase/formamidase family protein n=1 Tax=Schlesneria paludicola TaxID=360056 RepID=UPI00029ACB03|nr:acetamidase/formamidase family protein [Schlesneria paludicola]
MHHQFVPTQYYRALGPYEPVLRLKSGDTLTTTTVDAAGGDEHGVTVTPRGNPQTGPFHVEGAEPGDTLVVRLDQIRPNRPTGWARSVVAPNVVDPTYVKQLPETPLAEWAINHDDGTATLIAPTSTIGRLTIPLEPMLGCFGVAPFRQQAIFTATSGEHGGNMDYRGFVAGTTVYFPVFEPGALFFLGDGHAAQGDGEIAGTGIEISMSVTVTLSVLKTKTIGWPRGENQDFIFTVGNARPLDQCLQHATTEMLRWLEQDYGLDAVGANLLLSQCVRYDLGNMFDPAYTMVCKLPKSVLPARKH